MNLDAKQSLVDFSQIVKKAYEKGENETEITQKVFGNFNNINDQIESISAIAQEHSATNEEFLASITEQNTEMVSMLNSINNIASMWNDMKSIMN